MYAIAHDIDIKAPVEDVYKVVHDLPRLPDWFVGIEKWEPVGPAHASVGDRYWILLRVGAIAAGGRIVITEVTEPRQIAWESENGTKHTARITVTARDGGSNARIELAFELQGAVAARVIELISGGMVRRNLDATLEQLRHQCEFGP